MVDPTAGDGTLLSKVSANLFERPVSRVGPFAEELAGQKSCDPGGAQRYWDQPWIECVV